ncbi:uncharacterized protein LOC144147209 isoform X2 [Haemaphysalis longicornis]
MNVPSETRKTSSFQPPAHLQDRCWLIPVVAATVMFLVAIISSSKGYLYVLYMDHFVVDRETASWVDSTFLVSSSLVGAGYGATLTSFGLYTLLYFDKYKATATGFKFAALSVAGLATPAFVPLLVNRYGLQGSLLLCGACVMHAVPLVMLIKHPRPFRFCCHPTDTAHDSSSPGQAEQLQPVSGIEKPQFQQTLHQPVSAARRLRPADGIVSISWKSAAELLVIPEFYVLVIVYFVNDWVTTSHATTVVDYGRDKGAPLDSANYLQTYGAAGEILGRTVVPFLSDRVPFGHCLFAAAGLVGSSLALFGMTFNESFACFATLNAVLGVCQGYVMSARPVLIADYLGLPRLPLFTGFVGLSLIPISLGNPTILGFFRDTLGSYDNFYRVFGAVNIVASVPLFCVTYRDIRKQRAWQVNHKCTLNGNK